MLREFRKESLGRKVFVILNYVFCVLIALICVIPMLHILALSFSDEVAVQTGAVSLLPVNFTTASYQYVSAKPEFFRAFAISLERVVLGVSIGMCMTILAAYPLSMRQNRFRARQFYVWYFMVMMMVGGGLIPTYLVISKLKLVDTIWALVLPCAVNVFNIILLQNYFKSLPDEISESAFVDGAGHFTTLVKIILPLSKPVLATLVLFTTVQHWNAWFDGLIYMNKPINYPLQSYLQTIVTELDMEMMQNMEIEDIMQHVSQKGSKSAQIFLAMLPILCVYPFLQKYFTGGIVMGSVKG